MEITEVLRQMQEMWDGNDIPCEYGCEASRLDIMIQEAKSLYPGKPYCVISNWIWIDLDVADELIGEFKSAGVLPCFVRSGFIMEDEAKRSHLRSSVRSTGLVSFHANCIFVTRNTSYILVGSGSRVLIDPEVLNYLPNW